MKKLLSVLLTVLTSMLVLTVNVAADEKAVAEIGTQSYASLQVAVDAVLEGTPTEIKLVSNYEGGGIFVAKGSRNITLDLNGHTMTFTDPAVGSNGTETQALHLEKGNTITIKNGNLTVKEDNKDVKMLIQNYCDLTLDGVTVDGTNLNGAGSGRYVVSNNSGTVIIKDSTITAKGGDFAFDSCKFANYDIPTVNVTGSTITGKVEASGGDINFEDGTTVNGQVRVGENKDGGATGSVVTVKNGAKLNNPGNYAAVVFGENTLNISGTVNGIVGTNGNEYNAGSTINVEDSAKITEENDVAMYIPNGTLNISGGTITGNTAVYFKSTNLNITGGTLIGNGEKANYKYNGNGCDSTGDALVVDICDYPSGNPTVSITGGNFASKNAKAIAAYIPTAKTAGAAAVTETALTDEQKATITNGINVSGGLFSSEPDAKYIATGKKALKNADSVYKFTVGVPQKEKVDEKTSIEYEVKGNADVDPKKVEGLNNALSDSEIAAIKNKTEYSSATSIKIELSLNADKLDYKALDDNTKNKLNNAFIQKHIDLVMAGPVVIDLTINKVVKVNGIERSDESGIVSETSSYQYIPVVYDVTHDPDKIVVARIHEGEAEVLAKATNRESAEHITGDCYYINMSDGTVVIKSKHFSVYDIARSSTTIEGYTYVAPTLGPEEDTPRYHIPNTGVEGTTNNYSLLKLSSLSLLAIGTYLVIKKKKDND